MEDGIILSSDSGLASLFHILMKKVLIIEDVPFLAKAMRVKLDATGIATETVEDAAEALERLKGDPPDLILLDLMLPKGSGFDVLREIRADERWKNVPVFVVSVLGQQQDIAAAKKIGIEEYFVKADTSIAEIAARTKEYLARKPR